MVFAARSYASAAYAVMRCPSVRPSDALIQLILSKRLNISSKMCSSSGTHTIVVFPYQTSWLYSDGDPNESVDCRWDMQKLRFSTNIWLSIDDCCSAELRTTTAAVDGAVYHTERQVSVILFVTASMDDHDEENRTESNCTQR